jgi:hypothetical protein
MTQQQGTFTLRDPVLHGTMDCYSGNHLVTNCPSFYNRGCHRNCTLSQAGKCSSVMLCGFPLTFGYHSYHKTESRTSAHLSAVPAAVPTSATAPLTQCLLALWLYIMQLYKHAASKLVMQDLHTQYMHTSNQRRPMLAPTQMATAETICGSPRGNHRP